MTKKWSEIYSKHGLLEMIERNENKIKEKAVEYFEVEERYNPLMADGNRKEIKEDIDYMKQQIKEWKEALQEIQEREALQNKA